MRTCALLLTLLIAEYAQAKEAHDDIITTARRAGTFNALVENLQAENLVGALEGKGPFTVFAPTDAAFAKLKDRSLGSRTLKSVLLFHVIPGRLTLADLMRRGSAASLHGEPVSFTFRQGRVRIADASLVTADIACANGVIHVIDGVLLPPAPDSPRALIERAIDLGVPLFNDGQVEACAAVYEIAARAVARDYPQVRAALAKKGSARERAWALRRAFDQVLSDKEFKVIREAPLPKGFPGPGPLGRVVVKEYPRYRAARSDGRNSFWTLFSHIKRNKVEMTAPVEMTMDASMRTKDMAFLYEAPDQGEAGPQGRVRVLDLEPVTVLSLGMRGFASEEAIAQARAAIEQRIEKDGWTRAGDWRLMGYNSPMVPADKRFWELQVPVTR